MATDAMMGVRLLRGYLDRRAEALQEVIDYQPVFTKGGRLNRRYDAAVDELEEVEELRAAAAEYAAVVAKDPKPMRPRS